ncbi:hypothetical protein ACIBG8_54290 [Nonomuraea sp. NPDC050556]|uniref:hypothetical protein n=1 Tax=Nonomuraea sp. NPDC050556 TaxID=3364369 RepID=UPI003792612C
MCGCNKGKGSQVGAGTSAGWGGSYVGTPPPQREPVVWRHTRLDGTFVDYLSDTEAYGARSANGGTVDKVPAAK